MDKEITEKVFEIFTRVFSVDSKKLSSGLKKDDIETWDSIGHLQLVMNLESDFGIKLRTEDIYNIKSIDDCIKLVETHSNK